MGKWSNLTHIFQMGWNHQLEYDFYIIRSCFSLMNLLQWKFEEVVGVSFLSWFHMSYVSNIWEAWFLPFCLCIQSFSDPALWSLTKKISRWNTPTWYRRWEEKCLNQLQVPKSEPITRDFCFFLGGAIGGHQVTMLTVATVRNLTCWVNKKGCDTKWYIYIHIYSIHIKPFFGGWVFLSIFVETTFLC